MGKKKKYERKKKSRENQQGKEGSAGSNLCPWGQRWAFAITNQSLKMTCARLIDREKVKERLETSVAFN